MCPKRVRGDGSDFQVTPGLSGRGNAAFPVCMRLCQIFTIKNAEEPKCPFLFFFFFFASLSPPDLTQPQLARGCSRRTAAMGPTAEEDAPGAGGLLFGCSSWEGRRARAGPDRGQQRQQQERQQRGRRTAGPADWTRQQGAEPAPGRAGGSSGGKHSAQRSVTVGLVRFPLRAQRHGEPPAQSGVPCFS